MEDKIIEFISSDKYKLWHTHKLVEMIVKVLKKCEEEYMTIDDVIKCLEAYKNEC